MLVPTLITVSIILGAITFYIFYVSPKLNPLNRAEQFLSQNQINEAIIEYRKILEKEPLNFIVHYKLSDLYFRQKKVDRGVEHLERLLDINKWNYEVEKVDVLRKLARSYLVREEYERAFQLMIDILAMYPSDVESLYQVAFMTLGQELFEVAQRYFDRLAKQSKNSFEVMFGAGIAAYQNFRINDAVEYFKDALTVEPDSDIGNISMAFAQWRKRDYKVGANFAKKVVEQSNDPNAIFIARRVAGILLVLAGKGEEAFPFLEALLEIAENDADNDEKAVILYDLGFAALLAEKTQVAYEYWNRLYQIDRNYKGVQHLVTLLRKEMEHDPKQKREELNESVEEYITPWVENAFPENFIWDICGLKSDKTLDLSKIVTTTRVSSGGGGIRTRDDEEEETGDVLDEFVNMNKEKFRIMANRLAGKLGYNVDEILETYKESDGVDFKARNAAGQPTLIWCRRWKGVTGEIPLRNFAQAINDAKAKEGVFITTSDLTSSAASALKRLSKVTVVYPNEVESLLKGLI